MGRRINDGDMTGLKQDRFRNSRFDVDEDRQDYNARFGGVSKRTPNTISGPWAENRGRRAADSRRSLWSGSPFENERESNWRSGEEWNNFYNKSNYRGNRNYGGSQLDHEGSHVGKGPRGYKRSDDSIYDDVCEALQLSADVDASNIEVSVKEGIVTLNGNVRDRRTKKMAELVIENISGVHDIQNALSIEQDKKGLH